ncbi:peptide chain release factor 1 [Mycoplasmoides fastidiosum]|uniref:Peptide chain release factor 1 n=1 Tax=Mycoplasmoides fastidiosum TaxID=92758 RepID=A0ABU0M0D5_9BACT|nr:peptide chain release factor 1 [Mycoplasmoides fastidiosum]MDQ0514305.1 peptide chain release factor 1 [Mycoplasmoides fastidiosum]UUD38091.1 peptide chain release factor 1 [Mycoplasmoides fastidiosum]
MNHSQHLYEALKSIHETHEKLVEELNQVGDNATKIVQLNKKIAQVAPAHYGFLEYEKFLTNFNQAKEIIKKQNKEDPELLELAQIELDELKNQLPELEKRLKFLLIPPDPNANKNVIIEMRPAAGGDESSIFVNDLFEAYKRYAANNKWQLQILDYSTNAIGTTYLSFSLSGKNVYPKMIFESGVHRVQRVPATESKGRVHTSTITVSVLPEQDEVEVKINPADLRVDVFRAGGAGGQHVNKTESAVRITHLPTGIVAACQEGKSQISNREKAMTMLRAKLWKKLNDEQNQQIGEIVRSQVGTGDRSEKIRTYNYPQNRVTDHRINLTINRLNSIMLGNLEPITEALINYDQSEKLNKLIGSDE